MNEKALGTLEFHKVRERLATFTSFSASRELALALLPSGNFEEVKRRQKRSAEAKRLLEMKPGFSIGGARDVREVIHKATLGGMLEPTELLEIKDTLVSSRSLRASLGRLEAQLPLLSAIAQDITDFQGLETAIERCISQRAEIVDSASPTLARIRQEIKRTHGSLLQRLNDIVGSERARDILQEPLVTLRSGRYVVPVKAEFKGEFRGIVHDVSSSGATIFVEPMATVDLGNAWRELQAQETREEERILRRLSGEVGRMSDAISANVDCLAEIDMALASARYGLSIRATEPLTEEHSRRLELVDARHPLLSGEVVPISVELGGDFSVLVITGPNTGGKTVALKTVGLLILMAQAGLPIPVRDGSSLPVYDDVFADIGDEQSIEQSLSTFSSHMGNIIHVLENATYQSLVLLDELAAGTDPAEGSALARAILSHLLRRGITTIATTHHSELKAFAHTTPGVMNASVEFDVETLGPTFKLTIGLPGRSNAMAIASRLGLPQDIVQEARGMLPPGQLEMDSLLTEIQREKDELAAQRLAAALSRAEAEKAEQALQQRLEGIDEEKRQIIEVARDEILTELDELRRSLRRAASDVTDTAGRERLAAARKEAEAVREALEKPRWRPAAPEVQPSPMGPGSTVWIRSLKQTAELLTAPNAQGEVEVRLGALRAKVSADQIEPASGQASPSLPKSYPSLPRTASELPGLELHLRGHRSDEIAPELERYINDAFLAGMPFIRIVHGKGTGALRQVVREQLARHPLVRSFASADPHQGGEGVTVVELAT
ncbi:MAG: endonuclease MutS2 [Chloroflexota bacterium]